MKGYEFEQNGTELAACWSSTLREVAGLSPGAQSTGMCFSGRWTRLQQQDFHSMNRVIGLGDGGGTYGRPQLSGLAHFRVTREQRADLPREDLCPMPTFSRWQYMRPVEFYLED